MILTRGARTGLDLIRATLHSRRLVTAVLAAVTLLRAVARVPTVTLLRAVATAVAIAIDMAIAITAIPVSVATVARFASVS